MAGGTSTGEVARELAAGGLSNSVASICLNWSDVVKIRLQTQGQNGLAAPYTGFRHAVAKIYLEEGLLGLWLPGILPSVLRELSYSSIRFGLYPPLKKIFGIEPEKDIGLLRKIAAGLTTGAVGSALANPTDLVKIRFQREAGRIGQDGLYKTGLHVGQRATYGGRGISFGSTWRGFVGAYREGGLAGLYTGVGATIGRAAIIAAGQLATYDHTKYVLKCNGVLADGVPLHVLASLMAGLVATTASAPCDFVKSRVMADGQGGGRQLYRGPVDCAIKSVRAEGPLVLMRGWLPSYLRLGPHFVIALPLFEQTRQALGLGYLT